MASSPTKKTKFNNMIWFLKDKIHAPFSELTTSPASCVSSGLDKCPQAQALSGGGPRSPHLRIGALE